MFKLVEMLFRSAPRLGQVIRIRLDCKSGLFNNKRTAVYFVTKLRCKDANGKPSTVGLAFNKNEFDRYVKRGSELLATGKLDQPFEIGTYYGANTFERRGCVKNMTSKLIVIRLFTHKSRDKIEDMFVAMRESVFSDAVARYKSRKEFSGLYSWWSRTVHTFKKLFKKNK